MMVQETRVGVLALQPWENPRLFPGLFDGQGTGLVLSKLFQFENCESWDACGKLWRRGSKPDFHDGMEN